MIYEPNVEGHHVGWLRIITEDLLGAGFQLTLAIDTRQKAMQRIESQMADLLPQVKIIPARTENTNAAKIASPSHIADCLEKSGASRAFLAHFNDIASALLRRAAFGFLPDASLRGRLGGIYLRPHFLEAGHWSPNQALKKTGFRRLMQNGWLNPLLFTDPLLCDAAAAQFAGAPIHLLADPYPENFIVDRQEARRYFQLPDDKFVLLFYGGAYRRKGLHLAVKALLKITEPSPAFLLCAGLQPKDGEVASGLEKLEKQGRAKIVHRYVSTEEEKKLYAACDAVLLPYLNHQGTSGVFSCAAGAGRPVIASDENFIGRMTRQYERGPHFASGDVEACKAAILQAATADSATWQRWQAGTQAYAKTCSRSAFRAALVAAVNSATDSQP